MTSGNLTLKRMKRLPYCHDVLWNGIPLFLIVSIYSGLMTCPSDVWTLNLVPSIKSTTKSIPHIDSTSVISLVKRRSAPLRLKVACFCSATIKTTSPASLFGNSSASPWKIYFSPSGDPLSIMTSRTFYYFWTFLPEHTSHLFNSGMISPLPSHLSQSSRTSLKWPPNDLVTLIVPFPRHIEHFLLAPYSPPFPLQVSHILSLLTLTLVVFPLYKSLSVHLTGWITDFVFYVPLPSPNICPKISYAPPAPGCFIPSSPNLS